jgi:hypothetical protein
MPVAVDLERAPQDDACVAMVPVTQRCGLLHLFSRRLPGGGSLGSWGAAVHGEEETVVQLLKLVKLVRMPSLTAASMGVVSLLKAMVGASLAPLFPRET